MTQPVLGAAKLVAFAATTDAARAARFYVEALGLTLRYDDPFALVLDANGVELRMQKVDVVTPSPYTTLGWQVADVDATVDELAARGVTFERYPWMEQDARGVWRAPSGARIAWLRDPDGNLLSVAEYPRG